MALRRIDDYVYFLIKEVTFDEKSLRLLRGLGWEGLHLLERNIDLDGFSWRQFELFWVAFKPLRIRTFNRLQ